MAVVQHHCLMLVTLLVIVWGTSASAHGLFGRKLLSCLAENNPTYRHEDGTTLPLCITQYFPSGSEGQYTRVTLETLDPVSQAKSADLAHAWSKDSVNPQTDSRLQCRGEVETAPKQCWSGKAVETDATFSSISCCSTSISCYIKSGGCVLQ